MTPAEQQAIGSHPNFDKFTEAVAGGRLLADAIGFLGPRLPTDNELIRELAKAVERAKQTNYPLHRSADGRLGVTSQAQPSATPSSQRNDHPAFPSTRRERLPLVTGEFSEPADVTYSGLSQRAWLAGQVLPAVYTQSVKNPELTDGGWDASSIDIARTAVSLADAVLARLRDQGEANAPS